MTSTDLGTEERRRRPNDEIVDRVAVRRALTEIVESIEALQREAVLLRALLARPGIAPQSLMPRVVTLGQGVRETALKFEGVVANLSERQRDHSRVVDVRRTLQVLASSVPRLA